MWKFITTKSNWNIGQLLHNKCMETPCKLLWLKQRYAFNIVTEWRISFLKGKSIIHPQNNDFRHKIINTQCWSGQVLLQCDGKLERISIVACALMLYSQILRKWQESSFWRSGNGESLSAAIIMSEVCF